MILHSSFIRTAFPEHLLGVKDKKGSAKYLETVHSVQAFLKDLEIIFMCGGEEEIDLAEFLCQNNALYKFCL